LISHLENHLAVVIYVFHSAIFSWSCAVSRGVLQFSGIPKLSASRRQVRNEYMFQKAVVKSLQIQSSFSGFLVQTKATYNL